MSKPKLYGRVKDRLEGEAPSDLDPVWETTGQPMPIANKRAAKKEAAIVRLVEVLGGTDEVSPQLQRRFRDKNKWSAKDLIEVADLVEKHWVRKDVDD